MRDGADFNRRQGDHALLERRVAGRQRGTVGIEFVDFLLRHADHVARSRTHLRGVEGERLVGGIVGELGFAVGALALEGEDANVANRVRGDRAVGLESNGVGLQEHFGVIVLPGVLDEERANLFQAVKLLGELAQGEVLLGRVGLLREGKATREHKRVEVFGA